MRKKTIPNKTKEKGKTAALIIKNIRKILFKQKLIYFLLCN